MSDPFDVTTSPMCHLIATAYENQARPSKLSPDNLQEQENTVIYFKLQSLGIFCYIPVDNQNREGNYKMFRCRDVFDFR